MAKFGHRHKENSIEGGPYGVRVAPMGWGRGGGGGTTFRPGSVFEMLCTCGPVAFVLVKCERGNAEQRRLKLSNWFQTWVKLHGRVYVRRRVGDQGKWRYDNVERIDFELLHAWATTPKQSGCG